MPTFDLRFDRALIPALALRYTFQDDSEALDAGTRIRNGECTRRNLEIIFEWKTNGRGRSRLLKNTDAEVCDALILATAAGTDRSAVAVLVGLRGVHIPVASAVMTAVKPDQFTIIDFRALEALGAIENTITIDFYLEYLRACRKLADENEVNLRTLDRALWQWSKERNKV